LEDSEARHLAAPAIRKRRELLEGKRCRPAPVYAGRGLSIHRHDEGGEQQDRFHAAHNYAWRWWPWDWLGVTMRRDHKVELLVTYPKSSPAAVWQLLIDQQPSRVG